jgi:hypothetical protein
VVEQDSCSGGRLGTIHAQNRDENPATAPQNLNAQWTRNRGNTKRRVLGDGRRLLYQVFVFPTPDHISRDKARKMYMYSAS